MSHAKKHVVRLRLHSATKNLIEQGDQRIDALDGEAFLAGEGLL